jgi:hypothetical protein
MRGTTLAVCWALIGLLVGGVGDLRSAETVPPGLYVRDGVLMKDGRAYRGIGANYFSLFQRILKNADDRSSLENLGKLAQAKIPFVRFMCGGFWPVDQGLLMGNREEYFRRLDLVVREAEKQKIGLIPSLFWHPPTVPDLVGEPLDQYGNPDSKTIELIKRCTVEHIERYKDSPAIWGWEFGNEYNLFCDLPNHEKYRPDVWPKLGTPKERTARDELKFAQLKTAFVAFAETVRKRDPHRLIISGNAMPRPSAWHNVTERTWTTDTEAQFAEILLRDNPDPMNVICIHTYRDVKDGYVTLRNEKNRYVAGTDTIDAAIGLAARYAAKAGKPLFIGEFGAEIQWGPEKERAIFEEFLAAIKKHQVPLAAFWVFDLDQQKKDWNVNFENERKYMIEMVGKANDDH